MIVTGQFKASFALVFFVAKAREWILLHNQPGVCRVDRQHVAISGYSPLVRGLRFETVTT